MIIFIIKRIFGNVFIPIKISKCNFQDANHLKDIFPYDTSILVTFSIRASPYGMAAIPKCIEKCILRKGESTFLFTREFSQPTSHKLPQYSDPIAPPSRPVPLTIPHSELLRRFSELQT